MATERKLSVLDLYAGMGGWSQAFLDRGHRVVRVDNDEKFADVPHTIMADALTWEPRHEYDVVLASPPCQSFSLAATGTHMYAMARCVSCGGIIQKEHEKWIGCVCARPAKDSLYLLPRTEFGKLSVRMVERALEIVRLVQPKFWWMENPNGGMVHFVSRDIPRVQLTYCQYGESRQKLTNIWGNWPATWHPRPRCKNGDPCHESAPRGSKTGTQGVKGAAARALVPSSRWRSAWPWRLHCE